jgi:hypothetical protein
VVAPLSFRLLVPAARTEACDWRPVCFDHRVDVLRDLRKAGWIVLEVWVAEPGNRGHARRRYSAAQAYCTESGRKAPDLIGG